MSAESKQFREQIRLLERKLGLLSKASNGSFCCSKVTLSQCHALVEIGRAKRISLKALAEILSIDTSTTSRTVDALVKKSYVLREQDASDRRGIQIKLTEVGMQLYKDIERKMDNDFYECFQRIPAQEQGNVLHTMNVILEAFGC